MRTGAGMFFGATQMTMKLELGTVGCWILRDPEGGLSWSPNPAHSTQPWLLQAIALAMSPAPAMPAFSIRSDDRWKEKSQKSYNVKADTTHTFVKPIHRRQYHAKSYNL